MENSKSEKQPKTITPSIIGATLKNSIQTHGEASSQILQAYKGIRVDAFGNDLHHKGRSLKQISTYSTGNNPAMKDKVLKSQAGFSGELIKEARDNKEAILRGSPTRTRTTDGLGQTNNPIYDHVNVDEFGKVVEGSGSQMKIYKTGVSQKYGDTYDVIDKLAQNKKWQKYDCPVDIPSDQYDGALKYAKQKSEEYRKQANACRKNGDPELASRYDSIATQYDSAGKKVRKSNLTTDEAIAARTNPKKFVSKELCSDMHKAGKEAAVGVAVISGAFSAVQNIYHVLKSEKSVEEAAKDVLLDTASSSACAYGVEFAGVGLKAAMHSSSNEMVRRVGKTNAATTLITASIQIGQVLKSYATGKIDEAEALESLGSEGTSFLAAGFGGAVGAVGGPIGSFLGATLATMISDAIYDNSLQILKDEKVSAERRAVIESMCQTALEELEFYQKEVEAYIRQQNNYRRERYDMLFEDIHDALRSENIDNFIQTINAFGQEFNVKLDFETFEELDQFMSDDSTVFIL
ncbi:MAG: hypothetical protein QM657_07200 [Lacrimispora sp.]|uniref:hypothetical protein n=1 Tax=Lacrimispora sp. TaxID=2719234 RepID=UPI0039E3C041